MLIYSHQVWKIVWDYFYALLIILKILIQPTYLVFNEIDEEWKLWYINFLVFTSIFAIFDSILTMNTIYFDESKGLILDRSRIVKHYLTKEFIVDIALIIPLDAFMIMYFTQSRNEPYEQKMDATQNEFAKIYHFWPLILAVQFSFTFVLKLIFQHKKIINNI